MMSIETIRDMSRDAARKARLNGKEPKVFSQEEIDRAKDGDVSVIRHIPNLGTYKPKGWKRVHVEDKHGVYQGDAAGFGAYMVDSSGFGRRGEPALTIDEFVNELKPGLGYGIVEAGQFQVKIGAFAVRTN